jgi:hypothetical protein
MFQNMLYVNICIEDPSLWYKTHLLQENSDGCDIMFCSVLIFLIPILCTDSHKCWECSQTMGLSKQGQQAVTKGRVEALSGVKTIDSLTRPLLAPNK